MQGLAHVSSAKRTHCLPEDVGLVSTLTMEPRLFLRTPCVLMVLSATLNGCASDDEKQAQPPQSTSPTAPTTNGGAGFDAATSCSTAESGDVRFSVPSGTFVSWVSVELSTALAGAEIRYTTDGRAPSVASPRYEGSPLQFTSTTRIRAQSFVAGQPQGLPSAAIYVARGIDSTHDLPVVVLDAYAQGRASIRDRSFVDVAFLGFAPTNGVAALSQTPTISNLAAYHSHGQSSVMFNKASYRVELRNSNGTDRECELFGLPRDADFVLIGPHADKTLIHNPFVYSLGRDMGLLAPRLSMIELFLNVDDQPLTHTDYYGVYQMVEKFKIQKNRIELAKLLPTDTTEPNVSGGYIFKFEWQATEPPTIACAGAAETCWSDLELVEPDAPSSAQIAYFGNYLQAFNTALHSATPADPVSGYPAYIDVSSFVDQVIINEFTRNMDAYVRSQYFHKDRGKKIVAGPLWDFDLIAGVGMRADFSWGAAYPNMDIAGWQYESNAPRMTSAWFKILIADPAFRAQLVERWKGLRQSLLSDQAIQTRIQTVSQGLDNAATRNFLRWPILMQDMVMPMATPIAPSWREQLEYMRKWLTDRAAWLDTQWI